MPTVRRRLRFAAAAAAILLSGPVLCAGPVSPAHADTPATPAHADTPDTPATVPNGFVGVNLDAPAWPNPLSGIDLASQFALMKRDGVQSVRVVFDWATAQPYRTMAHVPAAERAHFTNIGGVPTDFAQTDRIVALASAHGMTVLPTVLYAPDWDITGARPGALGRPRTAPPYAAYLTALVRRYGPSGSFWRTHTARRPIRRWEIWNEPDLPQFWPQPFARTYVHLLKVAHTAVHQVDPRAEVVLGGLTNYSWKDLARIYAVPGARQAFDALALHPYTTYPKGVITILQLNRAVMARHGDRGKPLLVDEFGWASAATGARNTSMVSVTPAEQAVKVGQTLALLAEHRVALKLQSFDYYTWIGNESTAPTTGTSTTPGSLVESVFQYSGLQKYVNGTVSAKPVLKTFVRAVDAMEGHSRSEPL